MPETYVKLIDRKGEKTGQTFSEGTFVPASYLSGIASLSHCGTQGYQVTTESAFSADKATESTVTSMENDSDVKVRCTFKYASGFIRLTIPAPKINVEAGIIVRFGENRAFVPKTKAAGEVGKDGDDIAAAYATANTLTGVTFVSGRLSKRG